MIKVVLIEDDLMVQEVNRQFVDNVPGFHVIGLAGSGTEGLNLIRELKPDLALIDVYMPEQDGMETFYKIRREAHKVDVIAITAASDMDTIRGFIQQGAFDYIVKPFKFDRIKKSLEKYRLFRSQIQEKATMSQQELDEIFFHKDDTVEITLPKGLNQITLDKVTAFLAHCTEPLSAESVAEGVGLARVTVRRYLDYLEKCGRVEMDIHYGGIGRPINQYLLRKR